MGYYTQGGNKMERKYNISAQEKYSFKNKKITPFDHIPATRKIYSSENIPAVDQKSPTLLVNNTKKSCKYQIPDNNHNRGEWIS